MGEPVEKLVDSVYASHYIYMYTYTHRIEKLTEVIAELRHPSSLSQPTSNPVAESTQILPPPSTISTTATTTPFSSDDTTGSQSLATTVLPFLGGEDSQMSSNISMLELRDDADTLYKCLCIACEMLKELQMRKLSPTLQTLVDALVRLEVTDSFWYSRYTFSCFF